MYTYYEKEFNVKIIKFNYDIFMETEKFFDKQILFSFCNIF